MVILWIYANFADINKNRSNMYERKIPVDMSCPLRLTMSLIDSKWNRVYWTSCAAAQ